MNSILQVSRHIVIPPIMQMRVIQPRTAAAPVIPWYLSGGIAAANCLAAYTPKGAASLAASYDNNAAPGNGLPDGTYDCTLGVAPGWAAGTGWTFVTASTQYLVTGLTPIITGQPYSFVLRYSAWTVGYTGSQEAVPLITHRFYLGAPAKRWGYGGQYVHGVALPAAATMGFAGGDPYLDGVDLGDIGGTVGVGRDVLIGALREGAGVAQYCTATFVALAIYNAVLTAPQMVAVHTAAAAL